MRQLPHSIEGEQAVLGAMLIDPECIQAVMRVLRPDDFFLTQNRQIFETIRFMFSYQKPVDGLTVVEEMRRAGTLGDEKTIRSYLAQLMEITPTSANVMEYVGIVKQKTAFRQITHLAAQLTEAASGAASLEECRNLISGLTQAIADQRAKTAFTMQELFNGFLDRQSAEAEPDHIKFGFEALDAQTYPKHGNVVILGAEPDTGKTAFGLQCAYHMAVDYKVGYFSIDTEIEEVANRLVAAGIRINYTRINRQQLTEQDWEAVANQGSYEFSRRNLTVIEAAGNTVADIRATSQIYGFDVIFIDYVQQVIPMTGRNANRTEQMSSVSRDLKIFARSTKTMVVELAQIQRPGLVWKEPNMHSVKESGQFEQDADLMMMLFRPNPDVDMEQDKHRVLSIVKNKKGAWAKWPLYFVGEEQRFEFMTE